MLLDLGYLCRQKPVPVLVVPKLWWNLNRYVCSGASIRFDLFHRLGPRVGGRIVIGIKLSRRFGGTIANHQSENPPKPLR